MIDLDSDIMINGKSKAALRRLVTFVTVLALMAGSAVFAPAVGAQEGPPSPVPPVPYYDELIELNAAESRWAVTAPSDYSYTYRDSCFCPVRVVTVQVSGDAVTAVDSNGQIVVDPRLITDIFDLVRGAIRDNVASLSASYDAIYGYPTNIFIDFIELAVDDELGVRIDLFEPAPPLVEVTPSFSCLNGDGRVDLALLSNHPADGPIDFELRVGTVTRIVTLTSGSPATETVTGRPEGMLYLSLSEIFQPLPPDVELLIWQDQYFVDCDPLRPEVEIEVSCLAGNGRIDVFITNPGVVTLPVIPPPPVFLDSYSVTIDSLEPRDLLVAPGEDTRRITATGRQDGLIFVQVQKNGDVLEQRLELVQCDAPFPPDQVLVEVSCLAGNGRVDVHVRNLNTDDIAYVFDVTVGQLEPRQLGVLPGQVGRVSITGRPDGPIDILVQEYGTPIYTETVIVDCDGE